MDLFDCDYAVLRRCLDDLEDDKILHWGPRTPPAQHKRRLSSSCPSGGDATRDSSKSGKQDAGRASASNATPDTTLKKAGQKSASRLDDTPRLPNAKRMRLHHGVAASKIAKVSKVKRILAELRHSDSASTPVSRRGGSPRLRATSSRHVSRKARRDASRKAASSVPARERAPGAKRSMWTFIKMPCAIS
jgi:hypothetical protein